MTPEQYRQHKMPALRRAFFRGVLAAESGIALSANPYREQRVTKHARRGSWSEAFSRAWAVGWSSSPPPEPAVPALKQEA